MKKYKQCYCPEGLVGLPDEVCCPCTYKRFGQASLSANKDYFCPDCLNTRLVAIPLSEFD